MLARPTSKKTGDQDISSAPKGQVRPVDKRFLFESGRTDQNFVQYKKPAAIAGAVIKTPFPIVVVTVVDTEQGTTEAINLVDSFHACRRQAGTVFSPNKHGGDGHYEDQQQQEFNDSEESHKRLRMIKKSSHGQHSKYIV